MGKAQGFGVELFFAAEVVVDGRLVGVGAITNLAAFRGEVAPLGEYLAGGFEQAFAGFRGGGFLSHGMPPVRIR